MRSGDLGGIRSFPLLTRAVQTALQLERQVYSLTARWHPNTHHLYCKGVARSCLCKVLAAQATAHLGPSNKTPALSTCGVRRPETDNRQTRPALNLCRSIRVKGPRC